MAELWLVTRCLLTVVTASLVAARTAEPYDLTMIYRYHERPPLRSRDVQISDAASLEYRGAPLLVSYGNGSYIDPSEEMSALGCVRAVDQCTWRKSGWRTDRIGNTSDLNLLIVNWEGEMTPRMHLHDANLNRPQPSLSPTSCSVNNGGCLHKCSTSHSGSVQCSCPSGYSLQSDQRTCQGNSYFLYRFGGYGNIAFSDTDRLINNERRWLMVTPPGSVVRLTISSLHSSRSDNQFSIYDGVDTYAHRLLHYYHHQDYGHNFPTTFPVVTSSGNKMLIYGYIRTQNSYSTLSFDATFEAEYSALVLSGDKGSLTSSPVLPTSNALCMSVTYRLASYGSNTVAATAALPGRQEFALSLDKLTEVGGWRVGRFRGNLPQEATAQPLTLSVSVTGQNSSVFSIVACNPNRDEDVLVLSDSVSGADIPTPEEDEDVLVLSSSVSASDIPTPKNQTRGAAATCHNAGVWDSDSQRCKCPAGFIGATCEEGCGPNRYGLDCGSVCSNFGRGCARMIFCRPGLQCTCAPGLKGPRCDIECSPGHYGAGCQSSCGHCTNGGCDPYTGHCFESCSPGFYPPLCQETLRLLSSPPVVTNIEYFSATISADPSNTHGRGSTVFYQLQYKEKLSNDWLELAPDMITTNAITSNITSLKSGVQYQARVILIDADGHSYQDTRVPVANFETLCKVPDSKDYKAKSGNITRTSFDVSWEYKYEETSWCPVTAFEVFIAIPRQQELHHEQSSEHTRASYEDLLPGRSYDIRIRAVTKLGKSPFCSTVTVRTADRAPGEVVNLSVKKGGTGELQVSWSPPRITGGTLKYYRIKYQCLRLLACPDACTNSSGQLKVSSTSAVLTGLLPHAQYSVKVAGHAATLGPYKLVIPSTMHTAPTTAPRASPKPVTHVSNTSLAVQWMAASNCSALNGFFKGYRYQLVAANQGNILQTHTTWNTNASFSNLTPLTDYHVLVHIVSSGGWSSDHKLVIDAKTSPTVPDTVQDLVVYKKSRRMVGIRWGPPLQSYGTLESFTLAYNKDGEGADTEVRETLQPVHCAAWPELYCHTINGLQPDTKYLVSIRARNTKIQMDGVPVFVRAVTKEGAPGAPTALKLSNRTHNSLVVEWQLPHLINGLLRSFLVNVEETDAANTTDCCEYFPLQELPVRSEDSVYRLEVNGLRAASTLTVSISAKTVTIGPSVNVTANTRPERPVLVQPPEVTLPRASEDEPFSVTLHPSEEYPGLKSTYLLLLIPSGEAPYAAILDEDLAEQLRTAVGRSFYLLGEYQAVELEGDQEMSFGTEIQAANGTLGRVESPALTLGEKYTVGVALVLDYCGVKTAGFLAGEPFLAQ